LEGSQWQKEKMASEVPKPNESGTTTPASREPREIMIFVTNQRWECRLQEGTPYLDNGYQKFIKGDDNPHHWGYKRFQVYDAPGAGLIEVKAGDPPVQFWAHSKNDDKKLTLYWILKNDTEVKIELSGLYLRPIIWMNDKWLVDRIFGGGNWSNDFMHDRKLIIGFVNPVPS